MVTKKVDVICGLQYGSEGKGLIAGHFGQHYDTVVNVNMPNAGHTYITASGKEFIFKVLPNGAIHENIEQIMLGPDSVFSMERLLDEMGQLPKGSWDKLIIHENATMLRPDHVISEQGLMDRIGSTAQGSAYAMISKIKRDEHAVVGFDPDHLHKNIVTNAEWLERLRESDNILLEGCQGYSLGLNAGFYPYCTSRDCTPTRLLAGAQIPANWLRSVTGVARVHPIRVGGNSGPSYSDQEELSWDDIGQQPELTTVTKRVRRVFEFSRLQMKEAIIACQPDRVFLNFCNYDPDLAEGIRRQINTLLRQYGPDKATVRYLGWGPQDNDIQYT